MHAEFIFGFDVPCLNKWHLSFPLPETLELFLTPFFFLASPNSHQILTFLHLKFQICLFFSILDATILIAAMIRSLTFEILACRFF